MINQFLKKFIYSPPPPPPPQKILQIDERTPTNRYQEKSIKKYTYLDNKKNLWINHKPSLSKSNNNKSITNPSKKNKINPITFTQFLPLT